MSELPGGAGGQGLAPGSRAPLHAHEIPYEPPHESVELDREIQYHQLIWLGVGLLAIALVSGVLVFFMLRQFVSWRAASAPEAPLMAPPGVATGPKLLARPERELDEVRAAEKEQLGSYGWVDQAGGVARIPVERAMEIVAAQGLPARQAGAAAAAPAPATPAPEAPAAEATPAPEPTPAPEAPQ